MPRSKIDIYSACDDRNNAFPDFPRFFTLAEILFVLYFNNEFVICIACESHFWSLEPVYLSKIDIYSACDVKYIIFSLTFPDFSIFEIFPDFFPN